MNLELLTARARSSSSRVPLAMPCWDRETYKAILHCLIAGRMIEGPQLAILQAQILGTFGGVDARLCGSGSLALELALRACDVCGGDEVVLPTFCCTAAVAPVLALGATPVLADVGAELNLTADTVQAALTQKTHAVIVPHLFGNPAEIDRIVELVNGRNIRVIDDAAQALGATIDGRPVGSFGDAGVLSFGAEKVCPGLGGGVVLSRHDDIAGDFSEMHLSRSAVRSALENVFCSPLWRRIRYWTPSWCCDFAAARRTPDAPPKPYRRESMSNLAAVLASSLLPSLADNLSARRARVRLYRGAFENCPRVELIAHRSTSACLAQVIRLVPTRRDPDPASRVIQALNAAGYDVQGSYMPIHLLSSFSQCVWDGLPFAERVWADLVELPCSPSVGLTDLESITELVKRTLVK